MDLGLSSLLELPSVQPLGSVEPGRFSMRSTSAPEQRSISLSMQDLEKSGHIRPVRHLNRAKVSLPPMWLTIAILLGASLLFVSLCGGIRRLQSGATLRQLADGDGEGEPSFSGNPFFTEQDWIPLDADELEALCGQVGQWAPSSARHSASSSSLRTVDAAAGSKGYTAGYDMGNMQSPGSVSSGPSNGQQAQAFSSTQPKGKRPSEQYGNEWGDNPVKVGRFAYDSSPGADGPAESSGVQRLEGTVQQTTDTASVYPTDLGLSQLSPPFVHQGPAYEAADSHTTRQVLRDSMLQLVYSSDAPTEASSVPSTNADPTLQSFRGPIEAFLPQGVWVPVAQSDSMAVAGPSSQSPNEALTQSSTIWRLLVPESTPPQQLKHPFVRQPALKPLVRVEDIDEGPPRARMFTEPLPYILRGVRRLFLKPALTLDEANELVRTAIGLGQRALLSMKSSLVGVRASMAVEALGRRFLVFHTVHTVLKLTGNRKRVLNQLWVDLVKSIPTMYTRPSRGMSNSKHQFHHELSQQLSVVLELYKSGSEPTEEEILDLKRKLFCMEFSPPCFRRESWDLWRSDDKDFMKGS